MNCAAVITPSLGMFALAFSTNLLFGSERFERIVGLCKKLYVNGVC